MIRWTLREKRFVHVGRIELERRMRQCVQQSQVDEAARARWLGESALRREELRLQGERIVRTGGIVCEQVPLFRRLRRGHETEDRIALIAEDRVVLVRDVALH